MFDVLYHHGRLFGQIMYYTQQYVSFTGVSAPVAQTSGEKAFMLQMLFTVLVFTLFVTFYVYSRSVSSRIISSTPVGTLGFQVAAIPKIMAVINTSRS